MARMPGSGHRCCIDEGSQGSGEDTERCLEDGDIQEIQIMGDEEEEKDCLESCKETVLMRNRDRLMERDADEEDTAHLSVSDRSRLSENTRLATRYAVRIFREYLSETAQVTNFESMDKHALCKVLRAFYSEARSKSGQLYSKSSLISIRSSLNRYLNEPPFCRTLDLTKDPELRSANLALAAVIRRLEEQGAGPVVQKQAITRTDLRRLYASPAFSVHSAFGLLNKVWFEICMYFCTRGRENQRELQEDSFGLATDDDGKNFVFHKRSRKRSDTEENLARMYETGTEFCPYASFVKYLSKRNPACRAFFQRPRDHCADSDATWYENKAVGKNLLGTRMQMLSRMAKLSKIYTNHCIGAVSVSTLHNVAGIGSKLAPLQVEAVNGCLPLTRSLRSASENEPRKVAKPCKRRRAQIHPAPDVETSKRLCAPATEHTHLPETSSKQPDHCGQPTHLPPDQVFKFNSTRTAL